ncbi:uncharacterized protein BP5553_02719 [Venustampulla echinocandica]|uniref:ER membrane protein complex subunit 3 n=1 Tax=Venustampulla echinocandica TaxID=2656787 RepID=A0A370TS68_9HELO|nr:uncharacterized protein BP5553_02719 [Venustampulla echinocandica]RDL38379.1 hypothetical protein BP5553_02719 [Venustampulla echinocandica]
MAQVPVQTIHRDPQLFYWILIPITVVMILTGILRHYATLLMATAPKKQDLPSIREQRSLIRGINLRSNAHVVSSSAFQTRKDYLVTEYEDGTFLKEPDKKGQAAANPMTDPAAMEGMMGMMKGNMAMIVPQTLIMGWINAFFSGFVIIRLPFPLTIKFKSMLQAGVATKDMDPQWMSSISWYVLCIFGLQSVFNYLLGSDNAASQMSQQMGQMGPGAGAQMFGPGVDPHKQFQGEAENLAVLAHQYILEGVEGRLLQSVNVSLGSVVTLVAGHGPQQASFVVHREPLSRASPFFKAACSSKWMGPQQSLINLPEDDPEIVKMLVFWIYEGRICVSRESVELTSTALTVAEVLESSFGLFIRLFVLAEKYQMAALQNDALNAIIWRGHDRKPLNILRVVPYIYQNTHSSDSPLRRLIVELTSAGCESEEIQQVNEEIGLGFEFFQDFTTWFFQDMDPNPVPLVSPSYSNVVLAKAFCDQFHTHIEDNHDCRLSTGKTFLELRLPMIAIYNALAKCYVGEAGRGTGYPYLRCP